MDDLFSWVAQIVTAGRYSWRIMAFPTSDPTLHLSQNQLFPEAWKPLITPCYLYLCERLHDSLVLALEGSHASWFPNIPKPNLLDFFGVGRGRNLLAIAN
jgi:hypothetical protein